MDLEELKQLVELMNSNDLVEIELESDDRKIRLRKAGSQISIPSMPMAMPMAQAPAAGAAAPAPPGSAADAVEGDSVTFNSPMVGTFYSAPSPEAEPFAKVGQKISQKSVLCIIEAMKVMNEITADMEGEILEILVANGEAVEYGQPLFTIKPR